MERQTIVFRGYDEKKIKLAMALILKKAKSFNVSITDGPTKETGQILNLPVCHGTDDDFLVFTISITGNLQNIRNLVRVDTPRGVILDLLPEP